MLTGPKTRYSMLEKLVLALDYAARHLRIYFQGHPINVLTGYKLKNVLSKAKLSGRLEKWAIELGEHAIKSTAIKGQVLADFVTEVPQNKEEECLLDFKSTNNEAGCEAFLAGLKIAKKLEVKHLEAQVDSMLIAGFDPSISSCKVIHIKKSENKSADALSKLASTNFEHFAKDIRVKVLDQPSVPQHQGLVIQTNVESWMTPIVACHTSGVLPEEKSAALKIRYKSLNYQVQDGILYRRSFLGPLLRYVDAKDADYLAREAHEGICGLHAGLGMVVAKLMNVGYYWSGIHMDAVQEIESVINANAIPLIHCVQKKRVSTGDICLAVPKVGNR
ncbi:uncharacterized protein LOC143613256 [Bidens hawaiensis]|uniref:uncharacterized protein LOC143613256 n=1 Tax=Bidens hawaiensis TaxID=980011 RepID=UPI004049EE66